MPVRVLLRQQLVSAFGAEMRNVDNGSGIVGQYAQNRPCGHGFKAFSGFQDGQRAQQTQRVERFGGI